MMSLFCRKGRIKLQYKDPRLNALFDAMKHERVKLQNEDPRLNASIIRQGKRNRCLRFVKKGRVKLQNDDLA